MMRVCVYIYLHMQSLSSQNTLLFCPSDIFQQKFFFLLINAFSLFLSNFCHAVNLDQIIVLVTKRQHIAIFLHSQQKSLSLSPSPYLSPRACPQPRSAATEPPSPAPALVPRHRSSPFVHPAFPIYQSISCVE